LADFFTEGEDLEDFLDTAQGDVEGVTVFGLVKDAFLAEFEEVQLIRESGLMVLLSFVRFPNLWLSVNEGNISLMDREGLADNPI
jgi:hypothetical protein